jgi:predicted short-subunit dehydrogenase-like oxidoreductase (DUF2520 family)
MDIVMIGSGNVASVLGRKFIAAGHRIVQIISRNAATASELAYEWDTESSNYFSVINRQADIYILAVADNALPEIANEIRLPGKVVAHTAGSVPKEILKPITEHFGVFYPLQSIRHNVRRIPDIPLFLEGSDAKATGVLQKLAASISTSVPVMAGETDRMKLHIAAVLVSNFTNHLFALAEAYCRKEGIDFNSLLPLIEETVDRLKTNSPAATMTGPASRNDIPTIEKHMELLKNEPHIQEVYQFLTQSIQKTK